MNSARHWKGVPVPRPVSSRRRLFAATAVVISAALAMPSAAQAHRAFFGFGFGFPGFYAGPPAFFYPPPPPLYVPPPVVYAPPPPFTYRPPPPAQAPAPPPAAARCYAGDYVCPPGRPGPAGAPCSCPTNTGRAGTHRLNNPPRAIYARDAPPRCRWWRSRNGDARRCTSSTTAAT